MRRLGLANPNPNPDPNSNPNSNRSPNPIPNQAKRIVTRPMENIDFAKREVRAKP